MNSYHYLEFVHFFLTIEDVYDRQRKRFLHLSRTISNAPMEPLYLHLFEGFLFQFHNNVGHWKHKTLVYFKYT